MFIAIDQKKCMGHGLCYAVASDLLSDDDEGFVAERGQCWEIADGLIDQAREAADGCPESAITVTSTSPVHA